MGEYIDYSDMFPAEVCSVQGKPYLFTNLRVNRQTVHPKLHVYEVSDECDGEFWLVQNREVVDHRWATIIGLEPIVFDEDDRYYCPPDKKNPDFSSEGHFIGMSARDHSDFVVWYHSFKVYARAAQEKH